MGGGRVRLPLYEHLERSQQLNENAKPHKVSHFLQNILQMYEQNIYKTSNNLLKIVT